MKKIVLSIVYPVWFFFAKTWFGNVMMIFVSLAPLPLLINMMLPELMATTGDDAEGVGMGVAILTLMSAPFVGMFFMSVAERLEVNYLEWNYKTKGWSH